MKYFLTLIITISLAACNQNNKHNSDIEMKRVLIDTSITDNKDIIGQWTMCSTSGNGVMTNYNVCPKVLFSIYRTGSITFSGRVENFGWTLKKNALTISNMVKNSDNTFLDTTYIVSFSKEKNSIGLQIRNITNDGVFYLSKALDNIK
jgi:hypothetical protein